jgi:hypothetical protein
VLAPEGRRSIALGPASGPWSPARTPCSGRSLSTSGRLSSDRQSAARQNGDARRIGERHPHPGETTTIDNHTHYIEDPNATTPPPQVELVGSAPTPPMPSPSEAMTIQVTLPRAAQAARPTGTPVQLSATWSKGEMIFETFWEPGGDVIHYQDGNNLADAPTRFVVVMFGVPGRPMLIPVSAAEIEEQRPRSARRP